MGSLVNNFFYKVPASQEKAFNQAWTIAMLERLRWLFWLSLLTHFFLTFFDISRYQKGTLLTNPVHRALLITHSVSALVWFVYWIVSFSPRFLPVVRLTSKQLIWFVYVSFVIYGLTRASLNFYDRATLIFYAVYLMISMVILLTSHSTRITVSLIALLVMLPVTWITPNQDAIHRNLSLVEVLLMTIAMLAYSTYSYNIFIYDFRQRQLINDQNEQLQRQAAQLEADRQRTVDAMEQQTQELLSYILQEQQRNAFLMELKEKTARVQSPESNKISQLIDSQLDQETRWKHFTLLFERLHPLFFSQMQSAYPDLNPHDMRLMAMLRLNLSTKEIAVLLSISPQSANTARYRLRKRLNLPAEQPLESFLQQQGI